MKRGPSPQTRLIARFQAAGCIAEIVERRITPIITKDAFGCLDLIVLDPWHVGVIGVQVTSNSNIAQRVGKVVDSPEARAFCRCGNRIEVWAWRGIGTRKQPWRVVPVVLVPPAANGKARIAPLPGYDLPEHPLDTERRNGTI